MPRSQPQAGNASQEAPPPLQSGTAMKVRFQVEPGNEIVKGLWLQLTPMPGCPPHC
ncbi:hypothetical protein [Scytonema sp. HK-05]|uniref:hypothetical protein n=1 Tax=Scytonema sp. HK-05 TaxID=1137095 RepID=UPI000AE4987F|nr:hypothetical protein [Scytonema sp. HK-05]